MITEDYWDYWDDGDIAGEVLRADAAGQQAGAGAGGDHHRLRGRHCGGALHSLLRQVLHQMPH